MSCRRRALSARPALDNGVKGGKWFSLMDKVFAPATPAVAWTKVRANKGAAGEARLRHGVRKKSLDMLKDAIRAKTRRTRGHSLGVVIVDLNRTLRGWFAYFKQAHPRTFSKLDQMTRRRLRDLLRKQDKRPGLGLCRADHQHWPNAFVADAGLFALHAAGASARQPR